MNADPLNRLGILLRRYTPTASGARLKADLEASAESFRLRYPDSTTATGMQQAKSDNPVQVDKGQGTADTNDITPSPEARNRTLDLAAAAFAARAAERRGEKAMRADNAAGPLVRLARALESHTPVPSGEIRESNLRASARSFETFKAANAAQSTRTAAARSRQTGILERIRTALSDFLETKGNRFLTGGAAVATAAVAAVLVSDIRPGPGNGVDLGGFSSEFPGGTRGIVPDSASGTAIATLVEDLDAGRLPARDAVDAGALIGAYVQTPRPVAGKPLAASAAIISAPWAYDRDLLVVLIGTDPEGGELRDIEAEIALAGMPATLPMLLASDRPAGAIPGIASLNVGTLAAGQGYGVVFDLLPRPDPADASAVTLTISFESASGRNTNTLEIPLPTEQGQDLESRARAAAVVAGFAMLLRNDPSPASWNYEVVRDAVQSFADDGDFLQLVDLARALP